MEFLQKVSLNFLKDLWSIILQHNYFETLWCEINKLVHVLWLKEILWSNVDDSQKIHNKRFDNT